MSEPAIVQRTALHVTATGPTESGKSRALWHLFGARTPRVLTFDNQREALDLDHEVIQERGYDGAVRALRWAIQHGERWHVAVKCSIADQERLLQLLLSDEDGTRPALARAVGGVAVNVLEGDELAPLSGTTPVVRGAWKRGRHDLLSMYAGVQRPAECAKVVTSQAKVLLVFPTVEPGDIDWCRRTFGRKVARRLPALPMYNCIFWRRGDRHVTRLNEKYRPVESIEILEDTDQ